MGECPRCKWEEIVSGELSRCPKCGLDRDRWEVFEFEMQAWNEADMSDEINLEPMTYRAEYHANSPCGMRYTITASIDDEWGWGASITVSSFGMKGPSEAVKELAPCLEDALKALRDSLVKV